MPENGNASAKGAADRLALLASAGICILAAILVAGVFARYCRLADCLTHFQPHIMFFGMLLALPLVLAKKRSRFFLIMAAGVIVFSGARIVPWFLKADSLPPGKDSDNLRVVTVNVYTANERKELFCNWVRKVAPDILIVQEMDLRWSIMLGTLSDILPFSKTVPREDNFGIGLFSRFPLEDVEVLYYAPEAPPSIRAACLAGSRRITVIATHPLPPVTEDYWKERNFQFAELARAIKNINSPLIVAGDLNTTMWSPFYTDFVESTGLANSRQGFGPIPTWPSDLPTLFQIPLDHVLHSKSMTVRQTAIGDDIGSDHLPLVVDFAFDFDLAVALAE